MANFKPGDRVKVVAQLTPSPNKYIGCVGTFQTANVSCNRPGDCEVILDAPNPDPNFCGVNLFLPEELAPLTPPMEDTWATEAVRKVVKPLHVEPIVEKQKEVR